MHPPRQRRNRRKLLLSSITLAAVLVIAAVAQRNHHAVDPSAAEGTRARAEQPSPQNRPVFGAGTNRPESPLSSATPVAGSQAEGTAQETAVAKQTGVPADVLGVIERWRSSLARGDLETHLATYAPRVDRFYRQRRVSRHTVEREKQRMLERYPEFNKHEIHDVRLESLRGGRAVVTFRKDWDASGPGSRRFAGSERQRLTLRRNGSEWKIVGEEELKVHWVRRS